MVVKTAQPRRPPWALKLGQSSLDGLARWPGATFIYKSFLCLSVLPRANTNMPDLLPEATGTMDQTTAFCSKLGLLSNPGTQVTSRVHGTLHINMGEVW